MEIHYNKENVLIVTNKSLLVEIPFTDLGVWLPKKISRKRPSTGEYKTFFPKNFEFTISKNKYQQKRVSGEILYNLFDGKKLDLFEEDEQTSHHTPKKMSPKVVKIDDSLKR